MYFKYFVSVAAASAAFIMPARARADTPADACQILSADQVSAVVGAKVSEGTHVSPTFTKTCTWVVPNGGVIVTLNIQQLTMFQAGKNGMGPAETVSASGMGDEAYYGGTGALVALAVRRGKAAFKVSIYSQKLTLDQRKSMEKTLAQQASAKF